MLAQASAVFKCLNLLYMTVTSPLRSRLRYAVRLALVHLAVSCVIAALAATAVFGLWYSMPWRQMVGVSCIFALLVGVDVVCGPVLTLLFASPKKSKRELRFDLAVVAAIQLVALSYGVWSVFSARPVVLAFETDRLVLVTANEVQIDQLMQAPPGHRQLPWTGVRSIAVRKAKSSDELLESLEQTMRGVRQAMRPGWWRPMEEAMPEVNERAKPLQSLWEMRQSERLKIERASDKTGLPIAQLRYLPLTSSKTDKWVALIDSDAKMVGYAEVDGFD
jgi:hypothetical protein